MNAMLINCSPVKNGATAEIVRIAEEVLKQKYSTKSVCIDDYKFSFCKGCRNCHKTAECIQHDDFDLLIKEFEKSDIIICVSPSYSL
ncbi:MAG: NAD(P)H-dependent oxidoreductase [Treponema sp.]|nr:NAD(P)H-dependent oxidoreductase [Treponema sp.]